MHHDSYYTLVNLQSIWMKIKANRRPQRCELCAVLVVDVQKVVYSISYASFYLQTGAESSSPLLLFHLMIRVARKNLPLLLLQCLDCPVVLDGEGSCDSSFCELQSFEVCQEFREELRIKCVPFFPP